MDTHENQVKVQYADAAAVRAAGNAQPMFLAEYLGSQGVITSRKLGEQKLRKYEGDVGRHRIIVSSKVRVDVSKYLAASVAQ